MRRDSLREVEIPDSDAFIAGRVGLLYNAVRELLAIGQQRVFRELATVGRVTRERLNGIGSWEILEAVDEPSALVTPPLPGWQSADVRAAADKLRATGILVTAADSGVPPGHRTPVLRVSGHLDVRREDLDLLAVNLRTMGY